MSSVIRGGTGTATAFSDTLSEVTVGPKHGHHEGVFRRAVDRAKAEGYEAGQADGFEVGKAMGYQAGFDQAHAEASAKQNEMLGEFAAALQEVQNRLQESISEWFAVSEAEMERIAVDIAKKLVGEQLTVDRSFIVETTKAALKQVSEASKARIRVNPFDAPILNQAREELLSASASLRGIEVVADDSILGGCVIETERGAVDASIDTRLQVLDGGLEEAA